ncbi:MAG: aminotransferase class V-fold PLP-dependent enzyme [Fimbriimonadaceae bacterium]
MTRRQFVGAAATAVAFRNDALEVLQAVSSKTSSDPAQAAQDETYWAEVRSAFDVEPHFLYFNNGGCCPSPRAVQDTMIARLRLVNRAPSFYLFREMDPEIDAVRKRLAPVFGCDPEEIAITPNASESLFTAILGAPATAGDHMLVTNKDYPRVLTAFDQRVRRDGVKVTTVPIPWVPKNEDEIAEPIERLLATKPTFLAFPQISFLNGMRFPADRLCHAARKHGVIVLVDGAHGIGHMEDTAGSLQCDMYACSLHKWFLAPVGSGFLYVRKDRIKDIWPLFAADAPLDANIRKFEQFGTRPTPIPLGLLEAIDAHEAIGTSRKAGRLQYLRHYWTSKIMDHPKIRFHTPLDPKLSRALTTVEVLGVDSGKLSGWLYDKHQIFTTGIGRDDISGVRVTPQIYHVPAELDRLVVALLEAADHGIG